METLNLFWPRNRDDCSSTPPLENHIWPLWNQTVNTLFGFTQILNQTRVFLATVKRYLDNLGHNVRILQSYGKCTRGRMTQIREWLYTSLLVKVARYKLLAEVMKTSSETSMQNSVHRNQSPLKKNISAAPYRARYNKTHFMTFFVLTTLLTVSLIKQVATARVNSIQVFVIIPLERTNRGEK